MTIHASLVRDRQAPLRARYAEEPRAAVILKRARTFAGPGTDPLHGVVAPDPSYDVEWPYGIDHAVGGLHDVPNPGEMLCAALAACQDATVRMVADLLGVVLLDLGVQTTGTLDVRGTLGVDRAVRVGFQQLTCNTIATAAPGTDPRRLKLLQAQAERACVNLDTLRDGVPVATSIRIDPAV